MIKHNDNPMNNNFWYLFTQLISQLAQMHMSRFECKIQLSHWLSMLTKRRNQLSSAVIKQDFIVFNQY